MAGFTDLVLQATPALLRANVSVAEGATWRREFGDIRDSAGALIDMTSTTGTCTVYTEDGQVVTTLTYTGSNGKITLSKDESATVGLANGLKVRRCMWSLEVTNSTDDVLFWSSTDSQFLITAA